MLCAGCICLLFDMWLLLVVVCAAVCGAETQDDVFEDIARRCVPHVSCAWQGRFRAFGQELFFFFNLHKRRIDSNNS